MKVQGYEIGPNASLQNADLRGADLRNAVVFDEWILTKKQNT